MIDVVSIKSPEYKSNTYIVTQKPGQRSIIIDPTISSLTEIKNYLVKNEILIDYVIPTHGHFDHIEGIGKLREMYQFNLIGNKESCESFSDPKKNYSFYAVNKNISLLPPDIIIENEVHKFKWGNSDIKIIKTPGHSPCSVCILIDCLILFSGDTILLEYSPFSKFPDGNAELLKDSIKKVYFNVPHSVIVYPGHGGTFKLDSIRSKFTFLHD